jgi:hypothetical protein
MERTGVLHVENGKCCLIHDGKMKSYISIANEGYDIINTQAWEDTPFTPVSKFSVKTEVSFFLKQNRWCKDELIVCKNKKCYIYCVSCRKGRNKKKFDMFNEKGRQSYMLHKCKDAIQYIYPWFHLFGNKKMRDDLCMSLLFPNPRTVTKRIDDSILSIHTVLGPNFYPLMESVRDYAPLSLLVKEQSDEKVKKMKMDLYKAVHILNKLE